MRKSLLVVFILWSTPLLEANPEGFRRVSGSMSAPVQKDNETCVIQSSGRAIAEWQSFSLNAQEKIRFEQASKYDVVLNRVVGPFKSEIYGKILSNAAVYLINANGVFIGSNARIETAGFVASCLELSDSAFIEGQQLLFSGGGRGEIVHFGSVHCASGDIALIARKIQQKGVLEASSGRVALAVGAEVLLQPQSDPFILIRAPVASEGDEDNKAHISQEGLIRAISTELKQGSSVYAKAIQNSGIIEGVAIQQEGGKIYIAAANGEVTSSGTLTAVNAAGKGGSIEISAAAITIDAGAKIDASGSSGGGQITIGDRHFSQGVNAQQIFIAPGTLIRANADSIGHGGDICVFAEKAVASFAEIEAKGGLFEGNGGIVEVSSLGALHPAGLVNTSAPFGKTGLFLIDPSTVTVSNSSDSGQSFAGSAYDFTASTANINIGNLLLHLSTTNVLIDATSGTGSGDGSITITNAISGGASWTNNNLTMNGTSISLEPSSPISWSGTGTLNMTATTGSILLLSSITNTAPSPASYTAMQFTASNTDGAAQTGLSIFAPLSSNYGDIILSGTGGTSAAGSQYGVDVGANVEAQNITFTNCAGGASSGINNIGVFVEAGVDVSATATVDFSNIQGGSGSNLLNSGVVLSGTVVGQTINASAVQSGPSSDLAYGFYISGGTLGDPTLTTTLNISAESTGPGPDAIGILVDSFGTIALAANGSASLTGSALGGGVGNNCQGISLTNATSLTLSDSTILTLSGSVTAGADLGGNIGVRFGPSLFTLNGSSHQIIFENCTGGTAGPNNYGASYEAFIPFSSGDQLSFLNCTGGNSTLASPTADDNFGVAFIGTVSGSASILFQDCTGGGSSIGNQNYGVYHLGNINLTSGSVTWNDISGGGALSSSNNSGVFVASGATIQAPLIQGTNITGGDTSGNGNVGFYVNGATLGSNSAPDIISLTAQGGGSGTAETGIQIDNQGTIQTAGIGTIALNGTASSTSSSSAGIMISGMDSSVESADGEITLTGTGFGSSDYGIVLASTGSPNVTSSGNASIILTSASSATSLNSLANPLVSALGNITFNGPVILNSIAPSPIVGSPSTILNFTSTIDGAQALTIGGIQEVIFQGTIGGNTPLSSLTVNSLVNQNNSPNGFDLTATTTGNLTFNATIQSIGSPNGGNVSLTSTGASISVQTITTAGDNAGAITLQPSSGFTSTSLGNLPNGIIILNGPLNAQGTSGTSNDISLAPVGRTMPLSVATITSSLAGNDVTLSGENLIVGANEAITILGSLSANMSGSITIGDTIALDHLTLSAVSGTTVIGHGPIELLSSSGTLYLSPNGHIISYFPPSVNVTSVVGSVGYIGTVPNLTQAEFKSALVYAPNSIILNYDFRGSSPPTPPPPPSPPIPPNVPAAFFLISIADAEMEALFPLIYLPTCFSRYYPKGWIELQNCCERDFCPVQ